MLGWASDIAPTLIDVITTTGRDTERGHRLFSAEWLTAASGGKAVNDEQKLAFRLKVTTVVGIGEDETRYEELPSGELEATQTGQRKFNLQIQAITTERTDEIWSMLALERVRTRLRRPRSNFTMRESIGVPRTRT